MDNEIIQIVKEAEEAVLGMCLQGGAYSVLENPFAAVRDIVSADDFLTVDHQLIFSAIESVYSKDKPICSVSVAKVLSESGDLDRAGGVDCLYQLQAPIVETENATYYADNVREHATKRQACAIIKKVQQQFENPDLSLHENLAFLDTEREKINTSQKQTIEVITTRELSQMDIEPIQWVVPGLIPKGLTLLAGDAKIGKSFFAWNIAVSVAMRGMALSQIEIEQKRNVLYLALEDPRALLQERLISLCGESEIPNNIHVISDMNQIKLDAFGLKTLDGIIENTNSELIIIDTFKHVAPVINDKNGTSYDIDYARLIPVHKYVQAKGIAMILVMHTRKAADLENPFNQIQGSMGMQAGCDTMLKIGRDSGGHSLHVIGRMLPSDVYAISLTEGGIWELEGRINDVRKTETRQVIIELLVDAGDDGLTASDIITSSEGKKSAVSMQLRRMISDGEIIQPSKRGRYFAKDDDDTYQIKL